jgi:hypothetical protein
MVDRLQRVLQRVEHLPPEIQEAVALQIEALVAPFDETFSGDPAGALSDLLDDDEVAAIARMRHEVPPTPPIVDDLEDTA